MTDRFEEAIASRAPNFAGDGVGDGEGDGLGVGDGRGEGDGVRPGSAANLWETTSVRSVSVATG